MAEPSSNDETDFSKYAPRRLRDEPQLYSAKPPFVPSAPMAPTSTRTPQDRRAMSEVPGGPEPVPQPPLRLDETSTLIGRIAMVATFAAVFALVAIFAKPIWQGAQAMLDSVLQTSDSAKSNRLATNQASTDRPTATTGAATATKVAAAGGEMTASTPATAACAGATINSAACEPAASRERASATASDARTGFAAACART